MGASDDELYDEAYGPKPRKSWRYVPGEWDDPTWLRAVVDEEYMERADRKAVRDGWRPPVKELGEWISVKEAALLMRAKPHNLYTRLRADMLPFKMTRFGWAVRVRRVEVEAYVRGLPVLAEDGDDALGE